MRLGLEAEDREDTFVPHVFDEHRVDLGEVRMNDATVRDESAPKLLLIPAQSESWWGYEKATPLLAERLHAFAVDLRGQGRSTSLSSEASGLELTTLNDSSSCTSTW